MLPLCADQGIGVIPWSPLARGRLTRDWDEATNRSETDEFGKTLYDTVATDRVVAQRSPRWRRPVACPGPGVAMKSAAARAAVTSPIVGATGLGTLRTPVAALGSRSARRRWRRLRNPTCRTSWPGSSEPPASSTNRMPSTLGTRSTSAKSVSTHSRGGACSRTVDLRCCVPSSRTTCPPRSRSAPSRWSTGTTSTCRRRPSATTWPRWRRRATSPSRTPAPAGCRPTRATGSSSTGSPPSSRCPRRSAAPSRPSSKVQSTSTTS